MTDRYGWLATIYDRFSRTPMHPGARAWYEFWTAPHQERRKYGGYFLIGFGAATGVPIFSLAGAYILSTIKPDGVGGFRNSITYGWPDVNNGCYEGMPRTVVLGKHLVIPKYVNAYTEQSGDKQKFKAILYVCEGWDNGIESIENIRLNGQPLGHFESASATLRYGRSGETAVKGFDKVAYHYVVGAEMKKGTWVTYETHSEIDEIAICLAWNGIYHIKQHGSSAGSMESTTWKGHLEYRDLDPTKRTGWSNWTVLSPDKNDPDWNRAGGDWKTKGKTRGVFRKIIRVKFSTSKVRQFRIKATVANDDSTFRRATLERIEEIVEETVNYSGVAYIALEATIDGMLADGLPTVTCEVEGLRVTPMAGGTAAFTRNPAELIRAFLIDTTDGCGSWIDSTDIASGSSETWRTARDYFAANAASSGDHKEARHYLDLVVDVQQPALEWLNHMLTLCRSQIVEWDGKLQILTDKEASSDRTFDGRVQDAADLTERPIPSGREGVPDFGEAQIPSDQLMTHLRIGYYDAEDSYKPAWTEELIDPDWTSGDPIVREEVSLPGITRQTEALRQARYMLNNSRYRDKLYNWALGPGDCDLVPMDRVEIKTTSPQFSSLAVQVLTVEHDQYGAGRAMGVLYDANVYADTTDLKVKPKLITRQKAEKYRANPISINPKKGAKNIRVTVR